MSASTNQVAAGPSIQFQLATATGLISSFLLSAVSAFALVANVAFNDVFHSARLAVVLVALNLLHVLRYHKFTFAREFALYAVFFCYMLVQMLWTSDLVMARNTLVPSLNFILILVLFGSLVSYHNKRAVLAGMFVGFIASSALYTLKSGFPFAYPTEFSYNGIALIYLFGLFITLLYAAYSRSKGLLLVVAVVIMAHIVATTSIKTNLGIVFGALVAALVYFRHFAHLIRRNAAPLLMLLGVLGYLVASNEALVGSLERGLSRVALGIDVLQAREDIPGYGSFESRSAWQLAGLEGWARNPIFGNGVEAFRARYGTTSHSTLVDLLHNSGLIGTFIFYSVFASLASRLLFRSKNLIGNIRLLLLATLICCLSITMSGTMHYNAFLGAIIALSVALISRSQHKCSTAVQSGQADR